MRRRDKLKNIAKINKRLNESKFSWNGEYANEDVNGQYPYDVGSDTDVDKNTYTDPFTIKDGKMVGLPGDLEIKEEDLKEEDEDCGCSVNEDEPTDVESSQWFSDTDAERLTDKCLNC